MEEQDLPVVEEQCAKKLGKQMLSCITFMGMMKYKFGSVRREIFIAFAQPGAAN
ncbi:MAG TPA: hypothetical protein VKA40_10005 [Nitrososphaera sp.]|jgi:hypothetical protein|nr:hypothetical protein [Nitrososphaera sp.]